MAAEWESDQSSSLDPSDIIERYVDSDASDLSQPPAPIHDLSAEVTRLLGHHSSLSDESDDAGPPPKRSFGIRRKRSQEPQRATPFEVESSRNKSGSNPGGESRQHLHGNSRGGAAPHSKPPIPNALTIRSRPIEANDRILLTPTTPPTSPLSRGTINLAILRLQSNQSLLAGSPQGSARSSLSQLSDEYAPKPLAEELEEADKQEELKNEDVFLETDGSSEFYSSEEESEEEGSLLSEEIDFEFHEEHPLPQKIPTEQDATSPISAGDQSNGHVTEKREPELSFAGRIEINQEPPSNSLPKAVASNRSENPSQQRQSNNLATSEGITPQTDTPSPTTSPKMKHTRHQAPQTTGHTTPNERALTTEEKPTEHTNEAQHIQTREPSPPPAKASAAKQPVRKISSGLGNLLLGPISKLGPGPGRSSQTESEKLNPKTQRKISSDGVEKRPVHVKRFSRQKKQVTPPPSRRARKNYADSAQDSELQQHSPIRRKETGKSNDQSKEVSRVPETTPPEMKEFRWEDLLFTDSEDGLTSSESEEMLSPTPNKHPPQILSTDTRETEQKLSEQSVNPKANKPVVPSPAADNSELKLHERKPSDALSSVPPTTTCKPEPTSGLKPALVQQPSHSPLLKVASSPSLPLKGILKKNSRFGSATSTSSDITNVTPMGSKESSCSSLDNAIEISSTLLQGGPSMVISKQQPMLSQLGRARSSLSSSDDGCDLERTLTEEPVPSITHPAKIDQLTHTDSESTLVRSGEEVSTLHVNGQIGGEAFRKSLETQLQSKPLLTSSPITAHHLLEAHPLSKMQTTAPTTGSINSNLLHQTTQLRGDEEINSGQSTMSAGDIRKRVSITNWHDR